MSGLRNAHPSDIPLKSLYKEMTSAELPVITDSTVSRHQTVCDSVYMSKQKQNGLERINSMNKTHEVLTHAHT